MLFSQNPYIKSNFSLWGDLNSMGAFPGDESNSTRRTWWRPRQYTEILKFFLHKKAILRWCRPTSLYGSHHLQMFPERFASLKCKVFYKPLSSVRSAVNNKYRWVRFFFLFTTTYVLLLQCQRKKSCSCPSFLGNSYYKLLFSCTEGWLVYLLSHYFEGFVGL